MSSPCWEVRILYSGDSSRTDSVLLAHKFPWLVTESKLTKTISQSISLYDTIFVLPITVASNTENMNWMQFCLNVVSPTLSRTSWNQEDNTSYRDEWNQNNQHRKNIRVFCNFFWCFIYVVPYWSSYWSYSLASWIFKNSSGTWVVTVVTLQTVRIRMTQLIDGSRKTYLNKSSFYV